MPFLFFDSTMILLIPAAVLAFWAQMRVKSTYQKYAKVPASNGMTGADVARRLLDVNDLNNVKLESVNGKLSDHYDPRTKTLRLSQDIAAGRSVAALGIAAHEVGHAIQDKEAYASFKIRQSIVPVANIGSQASFPIFFVGILMSIPKLMDIGIILFTGAVLFQLVTLPVEFNASSRALRMLSERGYLVQDEVGQAKKVLSAAALTYVAATAMALMSLLRLIILRDSRN